MGGCTSTDDQAAQANVYVDHDAQRKIRKPCFDQSDVVPLATEPWSKLPESKVPLHFEGCMATSGSPTLTHSNVASVLETVDGLAARQAEMVYIRKFKSSLERETAMPQVLADSVAFHEGIIIEYQVMCYDWRSARFQSAASSAGSLKPNQLQTRFLKIDWGDDGLALDTFQTLPPIERQLTYFDGSRFKESSLQNISPTPILVLLNLLSSFGYAYHPISRNCQQFSEGIWRVCVDWNGVVPEPVDKSIMNTFWPTIDAEEASRRMRLVDSFVEMSSQEFPDSELCGIYRLDTIDADGVPVYRNKIGAVMCKQNPATQTWIVTPVQSQKHKGDVVKDAVKVGGAPPPKNYDLEGEGGKYAPPKGFKLRFDTGGNTVPFLAVTHGVQL